MPGIIDKRVVHLNKTHDWLLNCRTTALHISSLASDNNTLQCLYVTEWVCNHITPLHYRETEPDWHLDIQDDVLEECNKYGNVVHIYVDKTSSEVSSTLCSDWLL